VLQSLFAVTFAMSDERHVPIGSPTDGRHDNWLAALLAASLRRHWIHAVQRSVSCVCIPIDMEEPNRLSWPTVTFRSVS
jgi:hypothetical protein